jgi:hypothetical protein
MYKVFSLHISKWKLVLLAADLRPTEVELLLGDASKARRQLGWQPKVAFKELVRLMVEADLRELLEMPQCQRVIRQMAQNNGISSTLLLGLSER